MPHPLSRLPDTITHAMNFRLQRQNAIAANIANVDTPNYTPVELQFNQQLDSFMSGQSTLELSKTHSSHRVLGASEGSIPIYEPIEDAEIEFDVYSLPDKKGNSVDIDHESSKMAQNQIMYRALVTAYNKRSWYSTILQER
jgi:flagellar basal-body rod protein FlgB